MLAQNVHVRCPPSVSHLHEQGMLSAEHISVDVAIPALLGQYVIGLPICFGGNNKSLLSGAATSDPPGPDCTMGPLPKPRQRITACKGYRREHSDQDMGI
jgi:hypothetical protein